MKSLGMVAYEAYCESTGGVSLISGVKLPGWDGLSPEIQRAWNDAAAAVANLVSGSRGDNRRVVID